MPKNTEKKGIDPEEVVRLYQEEDMTQAQVADEMGCSQPNVAYLLRSYESAGDDVTREDWADTDGLLDPLDLDENAQGDGDDDPDLDPDDPEEEEFTCSNCGAQVERGTERCPSCGAQFDWGGL